MKKPKADSRPNGLSTYSALNKLYNDIEAVLREYKQKKGRCKGWLYDSLHHLSPNTNFHCISATFLILTVVLLFILYKFNSSLSTNELLCSAVVILILVLLNLSLNMIENKFRHDEMIKRVVALLAAIKLALQNVKWAPENYPHLCTPFSPCVTLQWVYRDGILVNLPWALLVKGDVIVIRPGQISPGNCESLEEDSEYPVLKAQEVYSPSLPYANEVFSVPRLKVPLRNKLFLLKETPYIRNLRIALDRALNRPVTQFTNGRYFLFSQCLELFASPCIILLTILFNIFKIIYLPFDFKNSWIELFLLQPINAALPLLPLIFPIFWIGTNSLGLAKLKAYFNNTSKASLNIESDHFTEPESLTEVELDFKYRWSEVWSIFLDILTGKELMMTRSANILHVLAHLSALCVVDKKGILSWPNPTAEKIFFLRNSNNSPSSSLDSINESVGEDTKINSTKINHSKLYEESVTEVLDVTHNQNIPFKLEFDDHEWKQYLSSLKPLGLAILLNTCNIKTQENYNRFCSHITCEAMYNEHLVPVANRRCLCELSRQIGFENNAQKIFTLVEQLSSFRHLQSDVVCKDKLARALHLTTKLKFPFPHMVAVAVKETNSETYQLFSQGTADIVLDSCVDYWNGKDLVQLSLSDRKKITDFYSRTSLTSYCTAFAYRPLSHPISNKLSQMYLELPSNNRQSFIGLRSPTPLHWDIHGFNSDSRDRVILNNFHSTDSLLFTDDKETVIGNVERYVEMQCNQIFLGMVTMQYQAQTDMVHLIERLERACIRFVHFSKENELRSRVFSEKMGLESGWNCHISLLSDKSNSECWANNGTTRIWSSTIFPKKVRKRCESEKVNKEDVCSLINSSNLENSKAISNSAPSAINLDSTLVKFDEDHTNHQYSNESMAKDDEGKLLKKDVIITATDNNNVDAESEKDSVMVQSVDLSSHQNGWASLSCLTDSTEQSAPVNFDMSNRAKLPRGIENIRPHLESIDNVPLLVSLFTDCTPAVTAQMLHIMQDYGQSVCVIGSVANADNIEVFMQADASIAVEPLYPQLCQRVPIFTPINPVFGPSPIGLNRTLNSLPCSITFRREDPVSIFHLILEARQFMFSLWNCIQFWICSMLTISCLQLITLMFLLPPLLSVSQVLWLICIIVPLLSTSLIGNKKDPAIMQKPTQKLQHHFSTEVVTFILWSYGSKFLLLIIFVIAIYFGCLVNFCENIINNNSNISCIIVYPTLNNEIIFNEFEIYLKYTQEIIILMIVLLLCILSIGFVHRDHLIWKRNPLQNLLWLTILFFLLFIQILYTTLNIIKLNTNSQIRASLIDLPWYIMVLICFAPIITFIGTEIVKWQEIQVNLRYLRRARLEFGTKLGMNSPF